VIQDLGRLPAPRIVQIGIAVAAALEATRHAGLVHRNIRPANILANRDGPVKLVPFGVVSRQQSERNPEYLAPEQVTHPDHLDFRADMYGLGATLYHAAVGRPPLLRATPAETRQAQIDEEPVPIWQLNPSFDIHLAATIHRMLRKNPAERFASWDDVRAALGYVPVVQSGEPLVRNANGFFLRDSAEIEGNTEFEESETEENAEFADAAESAEDHVAEPPAASSIPTPPLPLGVQKSREPLFVRWASLPPSRQTTLVGMLLLVVLLACVWFGLRT
jgi:serine/threonine protein kinase